MRLKDGGFVPKEMEEYYACGKLINKFNESSQIWKGVNQDSVIL
jgi:hypothetical protein